MKQLKLDGIPQAQFRADKFITGTGKDENSTPLFSNEPDQLKMFENFQKCRNCGHTYLTDPEDMFLKSNKLCAECEANKCNS